MADRMPTLEQQLAFLMNEEQQRLHPLTIEQQLASFIEEQQGRGSLFPRSYSLPPDRPLTIEHELASLIEQQQGRHQPFQATNSVTDRRPTIEQQLALLLEQQQQQRQGGRRDVFQATSSLPERVWSVEQQLACLTRDQQDRYGAIAAMGPPPDEASSVQQQLLARLIREQQRVDPNFAAAGFVQQLSPARSNLRAEHHSSQRVSMEHPHLQLLAQLERGTHLQQAQTRADSSSFVGLDQGHASLGLPPRNRIPIQPAYGSHESFPKNRYGILVEAERQGSDPILSLAQGAQTQLLIAASSAMNAPSRAGFPDMAQSLEHLQLLSQQQQQHRPDAHIQAQAGHRAAGYSFDNRDRDLPTHVPSSTASSTGTTIMMPPPYGRHGKSESFPGKLYRLMAHVEMVRDTHIVSFTPDGRSFKIHDPDAFMKDVSPSYFHQSQFLSFVRQLNLYGFERILLGPNFGAYAHPCFIRGRPELLCNVKRKLNNTAVSRAKTTQAAAAAP